MPDAEFEAMLARAAEKGLKRALADVGLDGEGAALDIRDLRSLLDCVRLYAVPRCRRLCAWSPPA